MTWCREYTGRWRNSLWCQPPTDSLEVVLRWRKAESEETHVTILPSNMDLKIPTWAVKQTPIANKDFIQAIFAGDLGSIPGLGRSPGGGHGNPLQYSWLENPIDKGAWRATVHGVAKSNYSVTTEQLLTTQHKIYIVQFSSVTQSCLTLSDPMNRSTPGLPVHPQLQEFTQTHVHQVSDAIQSSHPLLSPFPPADNPSQQ